MRSTFSAVGDPGYYVTCKMVAECALCLATQQDQLPIKYGEGKRRGEKKRSEEEREEARRE